VSGSRAKTPVFAQRNDIDLLLTDVIMPILRAGTGAALIGLRPELRVIFISGYADSRCRPRRQPQQSAS